MKVFSLIRVHTKHFFFFLKGMQRQNILEDKFYFSCGKINKYDHLLHISQIHILNMRQIIFFDNNISTCMGNFHKTEYFFKIVIVCNILYCILPKKII